MTVNDEDALLDEDIEIKQELVQHNDAEHVEESMLHNYTCDMDME